VLIEEHWASTMRCNADVASSMRVDGRPRPWAMSSWKSGEQIDADIVVSATPTPRGPTATWSNHEHRRTWTDAQARARRYSMSLFVWYFGTDRRYPDDRAAPHDGARPALRRPAARHLQAPAAGRRLQPVPAPPHGDRPVDGAAEGCDAFYALSPVPHLDSGTDWARVADGYRRRVAGAHWTAACCRAAAACGHSSRVIDAAGLPRPLLSYKGAAFGIEPVLLQSAWFRPHNLQRRRRRACTWWVPAPTRAPACRAC
jgi:phytoene desaturase